MKKIVAIVIALGILVVVLFFNLPFQRKKIEPAISSPQPLSTTKVSEIRASFVIFTNGTLRIFSDPKYHNLSPEVYIQSNNPNIIHIKKSNITWNDFFKTLPMKLSPDCLITGTNQTFCSNDKQQLKFYINGQFEPEVLEHSIKDGDQLLVSFGSEENVEINNQLQQIPAIK